LYPVFASCPSGTAADAAADFLLFCKKSNAPSITASTAIITPIPIPAFAPVLSQPFEFARVVFDGGDVAAEPDTAVDKVELELEVLEDVDEEDDELDLISPDVHKFALANGVFMYSHVTVLPRIEGLK
jgi:hypothetical protein